MGCRWHTLSTRLNGARSKVTGVVVKPRLTRKHAAAPCAIVHFGPGAFFRSLIATYTHKAISATGEHWGICAVSLKSAAARDQLQPQQGCFTSISQGSAGVVYQVIDSIVEVLVASEDPQAVLTRMSDPGVHVVTLTVTEKGYCCLPSTGQLLFEHPDIEHDLANPQMPCSVPGFLVEALARRRAAGLPPFSVVSCDNMPANGQLVRRLVIEYANAVDGELAKWIAQEVRFPATMVDRITPAITDENIESLAVSQGYYDAACVQHEPFSQWVIEDNFLQPRPPWELAGAQLVETVQAHELMKLRCLNGTHSMLAYLGYLAGYQSIASTVADPLFATLCERVWEEEIIPTVPQPEGEDVKAYCKSLLERYCNPAIEHRNWQIAMDGSQKLPQRLLGTVQDNLAAGRVPEMLCLAVAAWMRYVGGVDERNGSIDVRDPLAKQLVEVSDAANGSAAKVDALLGVGEVFSQTLVTNQDFRNSLVSAYDNLVTIGSLKSIRCVLEHR